MITTDKLYKLISTLQSAEKRFFKMQVSRQEGSAPQYMHLFQLMENSIARDAHQDPVFTLDEEALIVRMKRKGVQEQQFHVIRYQLAQMLFKSLRLMQEETNQEDAIRILLKNAEVLGRRGFFDWAGEAAEEACETAIKYEYHALALEALQLLVYFRSQGDTRHYAEKMQENLRDIEHEATLLEEELQLFALSYRALTLFRTARDLKPEETESGLSTLISHPLLDGSGTAQTFMSKLYFHHTHATLAYLRSGFRAAMPLFARVVDLWESDTYSHVKAEKPRQYIVHLSTHAGEASSSSTSFVLLFASPSATKACTRAAVGMRPVRATVTRRMNSKSLVLLAGVTLFWRHTSNSCLSMTLSDSAGRPPLSLTESAGNRAATSLAMRLNANSGRCAASRLFLV